MTSASARTERILYVRSGEAVRRLALDFDALAADVYWIRAIQHYGGDRLLGAARGEVRTAYPLLDLTTTLDPYFTIAYASARFFSAKRRPEGPAGPTRRSRCSQGASPLSPRSGSTTTTSPSSHYWHLRDFQAAANWFQRAAEQPERAELAPAARGRHADERGNDRAAARFSGSRSCSRIRNGCAETPSAGSSSSTRWIASIGSKRSSNGFRPRPASEFTWEGADAPQPAAGDPDRPDRHALRARSDHRQGDGRHRLASAAHARPGTASFMNVDPTALARWSSAIRDSRSAAF